jgi:hypothetical protein
MTHGQGLPPTDSLILEVGQQEEAIKPVVDNIINNDDANAFASITINVTAASASSLCVNADSSCVGEAHCATYPIDAW